MPTDRDTLRGRARAWTRQQLLARQFDSESLTDLLVAVREEAIEEAAQTIREMCARQRTRTVCVEMAEAMARRLAATPAARGRRACAGPREGET